MEWVLQDAWEYAENIVETVREPLVVLNPDLIVLTSNRSFYNTFKVTPEQTIGNFIYDLGNRQWDIPSLRVLLEEILPQNAMFNDFEVEHEFPDIGHKIILLNARQIFRKTIGSHIILLAMEDITERREAEKSLVKRQQDLEKTNRSLEALIDQAVDELRRKDQIILEGYITNMGEMINNIAHQWRQPLNMLGLAFQQVKFCYDSDGCTKEFIEENADLAMKTIKQMSQTIDDFRHFFRSDREKSTFSVQQGIRGVITLLGKNFQDQQINIDLQTVGDPKITGYPNEYAQVIINILLNACDALVDRHIDAAKISIRAFSEKGKAVVVITDNAGGIAEEALGRVFDPYFTTKGPDKGTGIGLFMSKTIIEKNMGGSLTVRNTGGGAEFRITI
jgi:C4-dicarboxylate-specific signal transduction histidine kinase